MSVLFLTPKSLRLHAHVTFVDVSLEHVEANCFSYPLIAGSFKESTLIWPVDTLCIICDALITHYGCSVQQIDNQVASEEAVAGRPDSER